MEEVKLTTYSHAGGCGCKISPEALDRILGLNWAPSEGNVTRPLVGNATRDDAAVYDLGDGRGLLCTTDFFMPIVDDAFDFGAIAAANALSDIYAMGGTPIGAIAILGWPIKELSLEIAQTVLKGASEKCHEAGIVVAGGHSVDNPEPVFGLAVSGLVDLSCLKLNSTAREGDLLFLTKPLGVGILSTAGKKGVLRASDRRRALEIMLKLNSVGRDLGQVKAVRALTDVTGFGLLGHLSEMCSASGLAATLYFEKIPLVDDLRYYIQKGCTTGGGKRNWESYAHKVRVADEFAQVALSDPQTNGGLLVAVDPGELRTFEAIIRQHDLGDALGAIGHLQRKSNDRPEIVVC